VVHGFYYYCGAGHVCPPLVHYLPQRHSFSVTGVHRTVIIVRLLAGKNLIIKLNQSIDENICVITNLYFELIIGNERLIRTDISIRHTSV
jgi:hypothetical protein